MNKNVKKEKKENSKICKIIDKIYEYDIFGFVSLLIFTLVLAILKIDLSFVFGILILVVNLYLIIKYRKNIYLFFCLISLLFFNYSFIISKYISSTDTLLKIYEQVHYNDTMYIGIYSVFIFICIIGMFLRGKCEESIDLTKLQKEYSPKYVWLVGIGLIIMISVFTVLAYVVGLDYLRALYEYSLILFILGFLICKKNKIIVVLLMILMIISMGLNLYTGGRIISLLPCIAFFFIFLSKKINYKVLLLVLVLGISFYTFFGLYGDIKDADGDFSRLSPAYLVETINERKVSLDTSISAYWTGLTFIEMTNKTVGWDRYKNFLEYMTKYTFLGNKFSDYKQIYYTAREKYTHYYGGFLTSYFYYWLGYIGVVFISFYVGHLLSFLKHDVSKKKCSDLIVVISVYVLATIPRWYLYFPATLFRGIIITVACYYAIELVSRLRWFNEKNN